jgi:pyruvate/2-oxoglutarate/acetoin dehydrogenase E1 component
LPASLQAIIVEECMKTGGIGASLSAVIHESLFNDLDHEVRRGEHPGQPSQAGQPGSYPAGFITFRCSAPPC